MAFRCAVAAAMMRVATCALLLAGSPSDLAAQAPPGRLGSIVVTAPWPPREAPGVLGPVATDPAVAPAQVAEVGELDEPGSHRLSAVLGRDASVGPSYATVGYYENFTVRGFVLDHGTSYRINGFVVPGEMDVALDNKDRIQVLKGVGTPAGGVFGAGGGVNFVSKRPADVVALRAEAGSRGGSYLGLDIGRGTRDGAGAGLRVNIAHERMHPPARGADGRRDLAAASVDFAGARLAIAADVEYQRREQPAVPGYQLLGGRVLPPLPDPGANINRQPWSRPVRNESRFAGVRADYALSPDATLRIGAATGSARIEDNLAFPYGCNDPPLQYFCANGDYVLYDYHAAEAREGRHYEVALAARARTGAVSHRASLGVERIERSIRQRDFYSATLYDDAGRGLTGNLFDPERAMPPPTGAPVDRPRVRVALTGVALADEMSWPGGWRAHAGLRLVRARQSPGATAGRSHFLPALALSRFLDERALLYVGAASGVELGGEAPLFAENAGEVLAPRRTRQLELGWKHEWRGRGAVSAAVFDMRRPYDSTAPQGSSWASMGRFERSGSERHAGIEASGRMHVGDAWLVRGSALWMRAGARGANAAHDGVQLQNVPRFRSSAALRHVLRAIPGLELAGEWTHVGARNARRDGAVSAPRYDVGAATLAWSGRCIGHTVRVSLAIDNLTGRRYWRDVGEAYGADLLFPGAPRTVTLAVRIAP